jgi:hypothetical protein
MGCQLEQKFFYPFPLWIEQIKTVVLQTQDSQQEQRTLDLHYEGYNY